MATLILDLEETPRILTGRSPKLLHAGWLPTHRCRKSALTPKTLDFSFRLRPSSAAPLRASIDGVAHESPFPAGNLEIPGHRYHLECEGTFESIYVSYALDAKDFFAAQCPGGALPEGPWPLKHAWALDRMIQEFRELMDNVHCHGGADRLDAAALALVAEALLCHSLPDCGDNAEREAIMSIASQLGKRSIDQALKGTGFSRRSFFRKWRLYYRESPRSYVAARRLERAASLLAEGMSVKDAAGELGFSSAFHLSREFKRHYGMPPSLWRQKLGGAL